VSSHLVEICTLTFTIRFEPSCVERYGVCSMHWKAVRGGKSSSPPRAGTCDEEAKSTVCEGVRRATARHLSAVVPRVCDALRKELDRRAARGHREFELKDGALGRARVLQRDVGLRGRRGEAKNELQ
jgi:hypothetical protein